jgi:hypothetical protein
MFENFSPLGFPTQDHPYLFDRVAIEATNTLRSAEVGIRAYRGRGFFRRLIEGLTGDGQEREATIFDQLRRANEASLKIVKILMAEEIRTQTCVQRVTDNLLLVNRDLDLLTARTGFLEQSLRGQRDELVAMIRDETRALGEQIRGLQVELRRHKVAGWLQTRFQHQDLYPGTGPLMAGSLYLAGVAWLHQGTPDLGEELRNAVLVVRASLAQEALSTEESILKATLEIRAEMLEPMDFIAGSAEGPLMQVLGRMIQRRRVNLPVNEGAVREELAIVRQLADPDARLEREFMQPTKFMELAAQDLGPTEGGSHA